MAVGIECEARWGEVLRTCSHPRGKWGTYLAGHADAARLMLEVCPPFATHTRVVALLEEGEEVVADGLVVVHGICGRALVIAETVRGSGRGTRSCRASSAGAKRCPRLAECSPSPR